MPTAGRVHANFILVVIVLCLGSAFGFGQAVEARTRYKSPAEQEAEEKVSLSAERIIALLGQEPGLLLRVKRILVRKAYEQGRILDPSDLTDDALFRLLREDDNVRVLATQEIENRNYIRAKPTREEIERELPQSNGARTANELSPAPNRSDTRQPGAQEEAYWSTHDQERNGSPRPEQQWPAAPAQVPAPVPQNPPVPANAARQLQLTGLPENQDLYDGLSSDTASQVADGGMTRISPEQLPNLLNASSATALHSLATDSSILGRVSRSSAALGATATLAAPLTGPDLMSRALPPVSQTSAQFPPRPMVDLDLDHPVIAHRPNPYDDVPSLNDLYAQVSQRPAVLERFGASIFRNGTGNLDRLPMDLPAGPEYVVGPGDGLSIELWGAVSQRLQRVVDREGRVALPEVGAIQVSGQNLGEVQHLVQSALRTQFHDIEADVAVSRIRSVRIYVVGDVVSPGAYDISSLSTPLNAVYAAGGPTPRGSLRHLRQYRGKQLVQDIDAYDLLLHGIHSDIANMQPGDTVLVPPIGPEVTVEGMVRRPALYEINEEKSLAEVLELAGGVLASGLLRHVDVERVIAHESRTMLRVELPETKAAQAADKTLDEFLVQDGDKIKISPILPYDNQTVYLDGHVFHPGKYPYRDGMKVTDLIHSYDDLMPEPSRQHAEIIRLQPPDYAPVVLAFNLGDTLDGTSPNVVLKPFDTVRVFSRYGFEDAPVITLSGEVRDPGDHITNGVTHLRDAVYLAGGLTADAKLDDAQIFRRTDDGKMKVINVDLKKALQGDDRDNLLLEPKDRIFIHKNQNKVDPSTVLIQGEVARPGKYLLGENMTAAELVRVAGGLKRGAYTEAADLTRYQLAEGTNLEGEHIAVPIGKALASEADTDVRLHDGDVLTIRQVAGWNDIGATIAVKGEVVHPGAYGIQEGERLSSILNRAGGFRSGAFPYGVIFERVQVRELEQENREQLIRQVQTDGTNLTLIPESDPEQKSAKEAAVSQWQSALQRLRLSPPSGRLVIHITPDIKRWANTSADVTVRAGDMIYIPKKPNFVMVEGSVYNPTAVMYRPGKNAGWYLRQAGGPTNTANKKAIFVVRADGSVAGGEAGILSGGVERSALEAGDLVMVPEKAISGTTKWKTTLESAQLAYAVGIAIQVARSF